MKQHLLIILCFAAAVLIYSPSIYAQDRSVPLFEVSSTGTFDESRASFLNKHFTDYEVVQLDIQTLNRHVKSSESSITFQLQFDRTDPLLFSIVRNDMRAPDYRAIASTELGAMRLERSPCNTYKGFTANDPKQITRLTIKNDKVIGYFMHGDRERFIEPLSNFIRGNVPDNHFVVYDIKDVKDIPDGHCGVTKMEEYQNQMQLPVPEGPNRTLPDCPSLLELATDADWEWFQLYGAGSNDAILTNLNMVEGVYVSTFNMQFSIVFQNVWQTSADPYTAAGSPSADILAEIRDEWEVNNPIFMAVSRDLMHLFSAKNHGGLLGSVSGGLPSVCSDPSKAHGFTADRVGAFLTTAHEIGHNFNGVHSDGSGCGAAGASIMCQGQKSLFFSAASCTTISTYINNNNGCIFNNGIIPNAICQGATVELDAGGNSSVTAAQINNGSLDGCGFAIPTSVSPSSFDCGDIGGNTVTLTVTNAANATANCMATVTVLDNLPPNANCMNVTISLDANGNASTSAAAVGSSSSDNCAISTTTLSKEQFNCSNTGNNTVTLTVTDVNGNVSMCNATVTVEDNIAPEIFCIDKIVEIQPDGMYTLKLSDVYDDAMSFDNCEIDQVSFPPTTFDCDDVDLTFPILVSATDPSGNGDNCTANITVKIGKALPAPWMTADIGVVTIGNEYCFDPCTGPNPEDGEFTITGSGNNAISSTSDNVAYAFQSVCGDKMITAKIESVDPNGYGGLMVRETIADGSKQVALFSNLTNVLRHETRYSTNGPKQINSFYKPSPIWLRVSRQGDWIFTSYSFNGMHFQYVHGVYVPMQNCIEIGLASFTYFPNQQTATIFSFVSIDNSPASPFVGDEGPLQMSKQAAVEHTEHGLKTGKYLVSEARTKVSVFPNPAKHAFTLQLEQAFEQPVQIMLYNSFGQAIMEQTIPVGEIQTLWQTDHLPHGVYWLSARDGSISAPVVISR